ncbi:hypothetical protein LOD99_15406 [Oopsacas minuta]|uniref:Uncharacterized protein n=1 Tax=Oopsacas minuta TaxID=111878 RepID=A0AAV7KBP6_9METZ|nr:hypothetical protein LOD99_15406 [Oopsacas minuta]
MVRNWLLSAEPESPFKCVGYTQGVNGIGAGVTIELIGYGNMNVITLYNATWAERRAIVAGERPRINRLLEDPNKGAVKEQGDEMSYEDSVKIIPQIRELCHSMNVAIFAIDSNLINEQYKTDRSEMRAMLNCTPNRTPLLVLNIRSGNTAPVGISSLDVCELLELDKLDRPWLVHAVCATELIGIVPGVKWCMQELDMI